MKSQASSDAPLIPFPDFQKVAKKVLSVSKEESGKQMRDFQKSNLKGAANKPKQKAKKAA